MGGFSGLRYRGQRSHLGDGNFRATVNILLGLYDVFLDGVRDVDENRCRTLVGSSFFPHREQPGKLELLLA